jgi:hypothetical protein
VGAIFTFRDRLLLRYEWFYDVDQALARFEAEA